MNGRSFLILVLASILGSVPARAGTNALSDATNEGNDFDSSPLCRSTSPQSMSDEERMLTQDLARAFEALNPFGRTITNLNSTPFQGTDPMVERLPLESRLCAFASQGPESRYGLVRAGERTGMISGPRMVWGEKYSQDEVQLGLQRNRIARRILLDAMKERLPYADDEVQHAYLYVSSSLWIYGNRGANGGGTAESHRRQDGISSARAVLEWFVNNGALCDSVRAEARKRIAMMTDGEKTSLRGTHPFFARQANTPAPTKMEEDFFRLAEDELLQICPLSLATTNAVHRSPSIPVLKSNDMPSEGLAVRLIRFATLPENAEREVDHRKALLAFLSAHYAEMEEDVQMRWFLACVRIWIQPPVPFDEEKDLASSRRKADGIPSAESILEWFAKNEDLCDAVRTAAHFRLEHLSSPKNSPTLQP